MSSDPIAAFLAKRGTLLELGDGQEPTRRQMADILTIFNAHVEHINNDYKGRGCRGINLSTGFTQSYAFNAFSATEDGQDYIAINAGVFLQLRWFYTEAIRNGLIGLIPAAPTDVAYDEIDPSIIKFDGKAEITSVSPFFSESDRTQRAILMLTQTSLLFGLHHELAHIWEGHCDYNSAKGGTVIDELRMAEEGSVSEFDLDGQAMEIDADRLALFGILFGRFAAAGTQDRFLVFSGMDYLGLPIELSVYEIVFCAYVSYRFLHYSAGGDGLNERVSNTHPPTFSRLWWFIERVRLTFTSMSTFPSDLMDEIVFTAIGHAEDVFKIVLNCKRLDLLDEGQVAFSRHVNIGLDATWLSLRGNLEKYKRGEELGMSQLALSDYKGSKDIADVYADPSRLSDCAKMAYAGEFRKVLGIRFLNARNIVRRLVNRPAYIDINNVRTALETASKADLARLYQSAMDCHERLDKADNHESAAAALFDMSSVAAKIQEWFVSRIQYDEIQDYMKLRFLQMWLDPHITYLVKLSMLSFEQVASNAIREVYFDLPSSKITLDNGRVVEQRNTQRLSIAHPFQTNGEEVKPPFSWPDPDYFRLSSAQCIGRIFMEWLHACVQELDAANP